LSQWKGRVWGEWLGSLMFTAMHLGYQPLSEMGYILLWGLAAAKLRSRGAAMGLLIVIHWLSDSAYVVCWKTAGEPQAAWTWVRIVCLIAVPMSAWIQQRNAPQVSRESA
jgi:membrane protease YdiL (CAAX protease family)